MIRITSDTPIEILENIKIGDFVTDGFSKTGTIERIEVKDEGLFKLYEFTLVTNRVIQLKK